jgi:4-nitrophenyl phosphatase
MYRGTKLCHGAAEFVAEVRRRGLSPFFLSNNSRSGPEVVAKKLTDLGVPTAPNEVITAAETLVEFMAAKRTRGTAAVIGSDWICQQLEAQGWRLTEKEPDVLIVGLDHDLRYPKLQFGVDALLYGAEFVAINHDPVNPIEGTLEPGCGCIAAALEVASGRRSLCIGKPSVRMLRKAQARLGIEAGQALMVGDSLVSDMLLARRGGTRSALLLSGQTSQAMVDKLGSWRPGVVAEDLADLQRLWAQAS